MIPACQDVEDSELKEGHLRAREDFEACTSATLLQNAVLSEL
jgi:hypothetical protein